MFLVLLMLWFCSAVEGCDDFCEEPASKQHKIDYGGNRPEITAGQLVPLVLSSLEKTQPETPITTVCDPLLSVEKEEQTARELIADEQASKWVHIAYEYQLKSLPIRFPGQKKGLRTLLSLTPPR